MLRIDQSATADTHMGKHFDVGRDQSRHCLPVMRYDMLYTRRV